MSSTLSEELLHHIWKFRLFNNAELKTTAGEPLEIVKTGEHNKNAGPDFSNALIKIGDTLWAGNVEIHINSSDWLKHNHRNDKAYDNIILHVVFNDDSPIVNSKGISFPTLILKDKIDSSILNKYESLKSNKDWVPCGRQIINTKGIVLNNWLERLVIERMETKSTLILETLAINKNSWEETFYQHLAKNFGFKINSDPFLLLAKSISYLTIAKHKDSLLQIEALLFGQAGFLNEHFSDRYLNQLQNEHLFLQKKFGLKPLEKHLWKFLRLRPANFPTIRIAQFANLIYKSKHLFSKILDAKTVKEINDLFVVDVSDYWLTHYTFEKPSLKKSKPLGEEAINNIMINTVVPFLFAYGKLKSDENYISKALNLLDTIKPEANSIITNWKNLGVKAQSAFTSQALIQLKNEYCSTKKCLECSVGAKILSR